MKSRIIHFFFELLICLVLLVVALIIAYLAYNLLFNKYGASILTFINSLLVQ